MSDAHDRCPQRLDTRDADLNGLEALEPRVLLSGDLPQFGAFEWRGVELEVVRDSFVLTFNEAMDETRAEAAADSLAHRLGVQMESFELLGLGYSASVELSGKVRENLVDRALRRFSWLRGFEPNVIYKTAAVPNDPLFGEQWYLENVGQVLGGQAGIIGADANLLEAWDITTGSIETIVAVIDTGVDLDHPDLEANIYVNPGEIPDNGIDDDGNGFVDDVNGWDFGDGDNDPNDAAGHGTAVAGTIAAVGNNSIGIAGVMWTGSILPMKIADDDFGQLTLGAIVGAHDYLTMMRNRGVNIVASNNSYGTFVPEFFEDTEGFVAEREAIQRFIDSGGVFVAAAGNEGNNNDEEFTSFPAAYDLPGIIAVAATDNQDNLAAFSSYGVETVDLAAPGVSIQTTQAGGGYAFLSGTSFSSPVVAGAVGLLRTIRPDTSGPEIRQVLIDSSRPVESLQNRVQSGGVLDIGEALRILNFDGPTVTRIEPGPVTGQLGDDGTPIDTITVNFNKDLDPASIDAGFVSLVGDGTDDTFDTSDDQNITIDGITLVNAREVRIDLDLTALLQQRLPLDLYRLTLNAAGFKDLDGNFLNGDGTGGTDEVYEFEVVATTGSLEPNDTLANAEVLTFTASGSAKFTGLTLGDGVRRGLDVDLFRIDIPRGGLIRADIDAQNRVGGSTLDSYLRLFDGQGNEIASNDQFDGKDSLIDFFVSTGGSYYIGVSGFPNTDYDPNDAGSGVTQSTGVYDLSIDVELVQSDRIEFTQNHTGEPLRLPPQGSQGVLSDTLDVSDTREIKDVNLRLDILHEFTGDLQISLISPQGTEVLLVDRRGGAGDDFDSTLLDDEAATPISEGVAPFDLPGGYSPDNALSAFVGESAGGTWTLVINDTKALDTGFLLGWTLDFTLVNDIFGSFESNDTIATAADVGTIDGTGSAQVQASIGDGGFGALDRDLYALNVGAGTTLNATVTSTAPDGEEPTLDTALRLFDANGNQLRLVSPAGTLDATIENFVFPTGGTFYLAVSEGTNVTYDPFDVTSGTPSLTTGDYTLDISVAPGVSDSARVLDADAVAIGAAADGSFVAGSGLERTGIKFSAIEFLFDEENQGNALHFFGATADGSNFRNGQGGASALPISLTDQSDIENRRIVASTELNGLLIDRAVSFGVNDSFLAIDVLLTNTTGSTISDVMWMEALNPDQGLNLIQGRSANTVNDILEDDGTLPAAIASFTNNLFPGGLSMMLAAPASDSRAVATFFDPSTPIRDPAVLRALGVNDPNGTIDDLAMGLTYDLGDIAPGQTTSIRYFILLGESESDAMALYDAINDGTGQGHLAADPSSPANETLEVAEGDPNDEAPTLPYRIYYPEGFANGKTSTFVPILNPHPVENRVVIIARYETGARDQIIAEQTIEPGQRGGVTITTPELFADGAQLVRARTPYAIEIRSQLPVAANLSHYDLFLLTDGPAAVGEAFSNRIDTRWTFGEAIKGDSVSDFILFMNTSDTDNKVTTTFLPADGSEAITITQTFAPMRRGGLNLSQLSQLPAGTYGVSIEADDPIIASLTHYDRGAGTAYGLTGTPGGGDVRGVIPEGQIGINSIEEVVGIVNPNDADARVLFSFVFQDGTTYRTNVTVAKQSQTTLDIADLPNFPAGQPYSVFYEVTNGDLPVSLVLPTKVFGDEFASSFSDQAFPLWGFGEGFRPRREGKVTEFLRLYNPSDDDVLVEITIHFDGGLGSETFRETLPGRRVQEYDIHDFVTGDRRDQPTFYGITVKGAQPIVAYMGHFDAFFPGGFGTLGTPLGTSIGV